MRRLNPWIVGPALIVGLMVGWVGWIATDLSCHADQPTGGPGCPVPATIISVVSFLGAIVGLIVVLALTSRSIAEYRTDRDQDQTGKPER